MPNLLAKKIKKLTLPFEKDGVSFIFLAKGRVIDLLLCEVEKKKFFLSIREKNGKIVIKGEKLTKPTNIGLLQRALKVFRDNFCEEIINEAILLEKPASFEENKIVLNSQSLLKEIKNFEEIYIEIGFGTGRHLLHQARKNPQTLVIGLEVYKPVIKQVYNLAIKGQIENIRLINIDARLLFEILPANIADKIFLHFPIPWGEDVHRRVVSDDFAIFAQRVLKKGGTFELRSDSFEYTTFTLEKFLTLDKIQVEIFKDEALEISSKYEDRWKKQNKNIFDVIVHSFLENEEEAREENFDFLKLNAKEIYDNFKNETYKFDDFFVHFEDKYKISEDDILIKLSFGSFSWPNHSYIRINEKSEYFIKELLPSPSTIKAHKKIMELLNGK